MPELTNQVGSGWGCANFWPPGARSRGFAWLLAIFIGYSSALYFSILLAPDGVALLWLPNAVLVTALFWFRPRDWLYVYAAGLLAQMAAGLTFQGVAPHNGLYIGVVNAFEATLFVACAALIAGGRRNVGLLSIRGTSALIVASVTVPALTGALGAIRLAQMFNIDYVATWQDWWFGDSLGLLVGVPIGLLLRDFIRSVARRRSAAVALSSIVAATLLGVSCVILAAAGNTWAAQQIAIAAAVTLSWALGGVGATMAAALLIAVTMVGVTRQQDGLAFLVSDQTLLFVVIAAFYTIAAATDSGDQALGQLSRTGDRLETANIRLASLLEATPDALIIVGPDGRIVLANAETDRMFGHPREQLIGSNVEMLMPPRYRKKHSGLQMGFFANPAVRRMGAGKQLWGLRRDGSEFPISVSLSPQRTEESLQVLAAIRDVTERYEYVQRLQRQRQHLADAEQQLKSEKERFELVVGKTPSAISVRNLEHRYTIVNEAFCELFGHKSVEDVLGRTEDEILPPDVLDRSQRAAVRLRNGESDFEEESIQRGAENILVFTQRFPLKNTAGVMTELATIRTDITHRKKIEQEAAERARWEERIGAAIGDGRLLVYSQPIVDVTTGEPVEEELLVRLRDVGSEEVLPPSAFLPQCERHGLMPLIDRYMVDRAIELAHAGRHVSVNITGQTIADATTMAAILEALTNAGADAASKITFEITETTALASPAVARAFSLSMRDRGCRVALDDFGTGYGTFTELRHLALYALKIDLSFVQKMLEDREDERVVNTIVFVAQTYGLTTIAEGVESQEVLERLAELGADRAQGYFFGEPKPIVA